MARVVFLRKGEFPLPGERYLVIEWSDSKGSSFLEEKNGLRYRIGLDKHKFWSVEGLLLARRMQLDRVYYVGKPSEVAWPRETRQYVRAKRSAP